MKKRLLIVLSLVLLSLETEAYSVLTHEAIIDVAWEPVLVPMLKQRFSAATAKELEEAHAFAYGGAIAPDMGYYPFGNKYFSDLVHYVRNGDFVTALVEESRNVKEYAFALGVLAHYNADRYGHSLAVNKSVPIMFPKLKQEYGPVVTYEEDPTSHVRTEFGFDVLQTARGNYASDAYHRFISFEVATELLKRAFRRNYNLEIDSVFTNFPRSVRTFRWAVKDIFPQMTKSAWKSKHKEIQQQHQTATARNFRYRMRRASFMKDYGRDIERPGFGARMIAGIIRILPKVGPLKPLRVVIPGPEAEQLFIRSFDTVSARYRQALVKVRSDASLPNIDFDTGAPSIVGEYKLADKTYYELLMDMKERKYAGMDDGLKKHIRQFYAKQMDGAQKGPLPEEWPEIEKALKEMKSY